MTQLSSLRSNVRQELKTDPNGRVWSDNVIDRNIREAVRTIQQDGSFDWPFNDGLYTGSSVIGQGEYDLPDDFVRMELNGIKYDNMMLSVRDYRVVFDQYDLTQSGNPGIYYLRGNEFGILPLPTSIKTMSFLYRQALPDMTNDSDDSGMPTAFDEAIQSYTEYLCWNDLSPNPKTTQALEKYRLTMQGLYAQYLGRRDEANFAWGIESIIPSAW